MQLGLTVNGSNLTVAEEAAEGDLADEGLEGSGVVVGNTVELTATP